MKNIFKFFGTILTVVLAAFSMTGCLAEDDLGTADVGLHVKVFFPTKVVKGQPMTINGGGFSNVTEIVFPGAEEGIVVTDFQIVNNGMIRVDAPAGISPEGGKILVRNEAGEQAESPLPLTLGNTEITGYTQFEGVVSGGSQMEIFGTDLEFVNMVEMLDEDGNPVFIDDNLFNRKGTDKIIFTVPKKVFNGTFQGKVYTIDGKEFLMPEYTYEPGADGGYFEIVRTSIWKNDGSVAAATWSGSPYRFAMEGKDGLGECVAEIPAETWEKMKTTPFMVDIQPAADWFQIRILDGWWSVGNNDANDITPNYEGLVDNGDGTFTFVVDLPSKPDLIPVLDDQHLLFAGDGFTILEMYWEEEVLVPGGGTPTEVVLWEGEAIATGWANQPNILSDAGVELQEAGAQPGQTIYLYMEPIDPAQHWYLELVEGHWSGVTYLTLCSVGADTQDKFVEYDLEANGGRAALEITQEMLDTAYVQQWWGGTFIANGDNLKITKVTLL